MISNHKFKLNNLILRYIFTILTKYGMGCNKLTSALEHAQGVFDIVDGNNDVKAVSSIEASVEPLKWRCRCWYAHIQSTLNSLLYLVIPVRVCEHIYCFWSLSFRGSSICLCFYVGSLFVCRRVRFSLCIVYMHILM